MYDETWEPPEEYTREELERDYDAARAEADTFRGLLEEFMEAVGAPCRYDHKGYCQAHFLGKRPCMVERARAALDGAPPPEGT